MRNSYSAILSNPLEIIEQRLSTMTINKVSPLTYYIVAWFGLPFIAVFNGLLRDYTYGSIIGEERAHQLSAILLSLIICFYVIILNSSQKLQSWREGVLVGAIWLVLTVVFEFALGTLRGVPLNEQLKSYDILHGNLWVLVLMAVFVSPIVFRKTNILKISA